IAVLLYHLKQRPKNPESMGAKIPPAVKQTLESMSRDDLIGLIFELADEEDEFRRALIAKIRISPQIIEEQPRNPKLVKKLKGRISNFFEKMEEAQSRYDDYRYREYDGESPEIDSVFEIAKTLNPADQTEVYWYVVECANDCSEDVVIAEAQVESALALYA